MDKDETKEFYKKIDALMHAIDSLYPSHWDRIIDGFIRGISFGLGTSIGVSIVLGILAYIISTLKGIPFLNSIIPIKLLENMLKMK